MAITRFRPQIWAGLLLAATETKLVYGSPAVVNRDYEGEIQDAGDVVKITSISDPTVGTYVPNSTVITPEELTDAQRNLTIDQAKYFAYKVDDVDQAQAKGNVMPQATARGGYQFAKTADSFVAGLYTGADAANQLGTVAVTTSAIAYTQLRLLGLRLDEADVPEDGRYVVARPWFWSLLLEDNRFIDASSRGDGGQTLRSGWVGHMPTLGFDCYKSNQAPLVTGDDYVVQAGVSQAITFAQQIRKMEAYRPESSFSDAVKGLHLYGAKLVRPSFVATLIASKT
jgi:N4-gp56 family major capsid protein